MPIKAPTLSRRDALFGAGALVGVSAFQQSAAQAPALYDGPDVLELSPLTTPAQQQGDRSTCAFFAVTAMIEARIARDTGVLTPLSEQFLIYVMKSNPNAARTEETALDEAMTAAEDYGVPAETSWPYNPVSWFRAGQRCEGLARVDAAGMAYVIDPAADISCLTQERPPQAVFDEALQRRSFGVWRVSQEHAPSWTPPARDNARINAIMRYMHGQGMPVLLTVKLPNDSEGWPGSGRLFVPGHLHGDTVATEACYNHFIVLTGFDRARGEFTFKNSWGEDWGQAGFGVMPFDVIATPFVQSNYFMLGPPRAG